MATALKHNVTITVSTLGSGTFTVADTATDKLGTHAYQQFLHHDTVEIVGEENTTYIPFHAIDHVVVVKAVSEVEITDDTCVTESEESSEGGEGGGESNNG